MTEQISDQGLEDEPVSKRTRRSGVVASIGDPTLKDRSRVAPLFLTKQEKQYKLYQKEQDKLAQSTKTRLNDWKSVIGVEKDSSKVCPVFQRASTASAMTGSSETKPPPKAAPVEQKLLDPLPIGGIVPDPYNNVFVNVGESVALTRRPIQRIDYTEDDKSVALHNSLAWKMCTTVNLVTPCKQVPVLAPSSPSAYDDIDRPLQTACISALESMSSAKPSSAQVTEWLPMNTRDWCSGRLEPRRQHALSKWLSKWKDEDTAVKRNRVAPILLVSGPTGCGKTALVYAAASELNIQVLEVSPSDFSWQANGKRPMSEAVKEALQSRQVKSDNVLSQIVLIDDVDVLVREDRSVLNAIISMTDDSKRPLVLTCTDDSGITNNTNLELTETFEILPIDFLTRSFLVHAYSLVLGQAIPRVEADLVAKHTGSDLRRIAMSAELSRCTTIRDDEGLIPNSVYGMDWDVEVFTDTEGLIRRLSSDKGLPITLRSTGTEIDVLDLVFHIIESDPDRFHLDDWHLLMSDLAVGCLTAVPEAYGARMALDSACLRTHRNQWITESELKSTIDAGTLKRISHPDNLIEPFLSTRTAFYVNASRQRQGTVLSHLGILAQLSNASEFSSRRVRCFLDQFSGASEEINELRRLFPRN